MTEQFKGADELNIRTLAQERKLASFSPREMEHFLNGGQDRTALKEKMCIALVFGCCFSLVFAYRLMLCACPLHIACFADVNSFSSDAQDGHPGI